MESLVINNSRWKYFLFLLVSLGLAGGGLLILHDARFTREAWIGWVNLLLFGSCAALFTWRIFDPLLRVKIDDRGIEARSLGVGLISWPEIADACVRSIQGKDFICLLVRNPNIPMGFQEVNIDLSGTGAETNHIHELIRKLRIASRKSGQ